VSRQRQTLQRFRVDTDLRRKAVDRRWHSRGWKGPSGDGLRRTMGARHSAHTAAVRVGPFGLVLATSSWTPVFVSRPLNLSFLIWGPLPVSVVASCARLNTLMRNSFSAPRHSTASHHKPWLGSLLKISWYKMRYKRVYFALGTFRVPKIASVI
jgi:hypothetical protein